MSSIFKIIFKSMLIVIGIASSYAMANSAPNMCSRDQNDNEFTILSYHEIADKSETLDSTYAVTPLHFDEQMHWLIEHGYHFVDIDDILKYRKTGKPLPNKAVLVTFDDGYQSVYANAYPVIKKYKIPTVIALVGSWLKTKDKVNFNGEIIARDKFLSQKEIKEMVSSGLVEVASHSYFLHKGIQGNPQGNMEPAVTTRQWLTDKHSYEDEKSYKKRVYNDLLENNIFLEKYTGQKPRVMVWPYGRYNIEVRRIAEQLGMPIGLTLDDGSNTRITPLWGLRRILVDKNMTLKDLEQNMRFRNANLTDDDRTTKAAHIDLDYIYDPDPVQQEKNLGNLLDRIKRLGVNTVYLQAFADPDANGAADYVYFPNRNIPMRADLFNRVAWQIATCTQVKRVYAWMPMMAWQLPKKNIAAKDMVVTLQVDPTHLNMGYPRLSPFSPKAQKIIKQIYEDLSKSAYIDGILFHDDVTLSDFEDDSEAAHVQYKKWGLFDSVTRIRADRNQFAKWTKLKTQYLDDFAMQLAQIVRNEQPGLKTARNLYAQVALNNNAEEWYAQNLAESIKYYDYTAIMAMPYMEQASDDKQFYDKIVKHVKQDRCGLERTVIELQTVNWRKDNEPISSQEMSKTIKYLYGLGVHHVAYYPDNLYKNNPDADMIKQTFAQKPVRMHAIMPNNKKD
ncbi:MAG: poly-beta-1,6-N-acetyl-D-glucosamine N-deacetylase PgaB [Sulfurovaceae bacterium]|nr:poly-beta-1,6-N-acetyl-D-glucosamine N-deacetylase PgaB [Sulfurovaceae bacterium]